MKSKKTIRILPLNPVYVILLIIIWSFLGFLLISPFSFLLSNEKIVLGNSLILKNGLIQFMMTFPVSVCLSYPFARNTLYVVKFSGDDIIVPRIRKIQQKIAVKCEDINACKFISINVSFYYSFTYGTDKTFNILMTSFSKKQLFQLLTMIQERGGLPDFDVHGLIREAYPRHSGMKR